MHLRSIPTSFIHTWSAAQLCTWLSWATFAFSLFCYQDVPYHFQEKGSTTKK